MTKRLITVFGGSGFIGRYVVQRLASQGHLVRVAVRRPNEALFLKPLGDVGQVQIIAANLKNEASVERAIQGADAVVNLVGILHNSGGQTFEALQADGAATVARIAAAAGVNNLVHMSAIGADEESAAQYARTKARGEQAVLDAFPNASILRPSVVIGHEDGFFNRFAGLAKLLPVLPLPGLETKFRPVFVGDVADAVVKCLDGGESVEGMTFELGGPQVMTMREMLNFMMDHIDVHRPIVPLPLGIAKFQAFFMGLLPNPPLTLDQIKLLQSDNITAKGSKGFKALGITPSSIEAILPKYCVHYKPQGQFSKS
ncbi:complex I NDUFA9 subunit family protein [Kordiimonas sp. SCSIO 12610]|uniref:complex I NDUFA9 subunit family protein n=1 Tax=Kordiimonas sp. SCSIO 12610 TaxID=2829597 RepID=UPI00210B5468|nr:complex I NDUFA9 subunit family protein [Kordiimonas sp. SCSIO 12610]UTW55416.1 complex I NDUFA9 subunit family protein [Kordiimonas sp. SCSIO 12610]